ncbi:MAG: SdpI family protein [Anaerolineaceae bacterium]|nr:SdpI family protein [Anaerolineaceae bacterium]
MNNRLTWIFSLLLILAAVLVSVVAGPNLPEQVATHWNAYGEADGYSLRLTAMMLTPAIMVGITLLLLAIPLIDPLKANIRLFRTAYNLLIIFLNLYLLYIHVLTVLWGLGVRYNMNRALTPALGLLFYFMGVLIGKARRNYMIGIRTPWTLASDVVWDKTHRLGGLLFKIAGVLALVGVFFPNYALWFILVPVLAATVWSLVYSYVIYRREERAAH